MLAFRWRTQRRSWIPVLTAVMVGLAVATPWLVRNWVVLGKPVFISTSLEDVWKGNHPNASGSSYLPNGKDVFSAAPPELQARFQQATELELNDVFAQEVVAFVTQHPADFASLVARKFVYFWWLSPQAGLLYPATWLTGYEVYALLIYTFAAVGAAGIIRGGSPAERTLLGMLATVALTIAAIHAVAYVEGRHRWGVEPLLLLLTARGCFAASSALRNAARGGQLSLFRREIDR